MGQVQQLNVAIIDEHPRFIEAAYGHVFENCNVDFFGDHKAFGQALLGRYDVIIASYSLPNINGVEILRSIKKKIRPDTKLGLMRRPSEAWVGSELADDDTFFGIFTKDCDGSSIASFLESVRRTRECKVAAGKARESLARAFSAIDKLKNIGFNTTSSKRFVIPEAFPSMNQ